MLLVVSCRPPRRESVPPPPRPVLPTVADRVAQYGARARGRLVPFFTAAGVPYPPERLVLLGLKSERRLELYAAGGGRPLAFVRAYSILAASGRLGPKLRQGDRQVPEGVYAIESLNPNSRFHLSLRIGYPNAWDLARAQEDGRDDLGGDIMIHGDFESAGCLAMGDEAAEDLFVLSADAGIERAVVVLSPVDFRRVTLPKKWIAPTPWTPSLYADLRREVQALPPPIVRPAAVAAPVTTSSTP
jgi:hypothetical protein